MKKVILSAFLYVLIAVLPVIIAGLSEDRPITPKVAWIIGLGALLAGANALKAFMSQAFSNEQLERIGGTPVRVTNDSEHPVPTDPQK